VLQWHCWLSPVNRRYGLHPRYLASFELAESCICYYVQSCVSLLYALQLCRECFYHNFEEEIHDTIIKNRLFIKGERVAVGASGEHFLRHAVLQLLKKCTFRVSHCK